MARKKSPAELREDARRMLEAAKQAKAFYRLTKDDTKPIEGR